MLFQIFVYTPLYTERYLNLLQTIKLN